MTKRIALVLPNMGGGGAERVALSLIEGFLQRGHEVDLVLMRAEGELISLVPPDTRVVDLHAKRIRNALWPLVRYLRERRLDAVLASLWPLTVVTILAARLSGTKARVVTSDHAILSKQYGSSLALRLSTRFVYPLADARVAVSEGVAEDLASLSALPRESFTVIHNPVTPPPGPIATSPQVELLWAGKGKRILTVGSLKAAKNHALLLRAFALLGQRRDAQLMIVGEGDLRPALERQAKALGIAGRLIMPGFAADLWPYYASADLFVLSSDHEGFGNVLVEAMLAGLPLVSIDCPSGPREILDDGRFGGLVPAGDADALAKAMFAALDEFHDAEPGRAQARRLSEGAIERYAALMLGDGHS